MLTPDPFNSIAVIVGRDLVGDALIKLPFLRALRNAFPRAKISWITSQGPTAFNNVLRAPTRGLIDDIFEQPDWLGVWDRRAKIRDVMAKIFFYSPAPIAHAHAPFFDLVIDTRNRWREVIYARRVPHKVFIAPAMHFLFSGRRPSFLGSRPAHLCGRLLELVQLAAGYLPPSTGALPIAKSDLEKARQILPEGPVYIGLAPGAGHLEKAWPRYKFVKVAQAQVAKGRVPVFILGPQELSWYDELQASIPQAKFPLQQYDMWGEHTITLGHTLAIGSLLDAAVANDSGTGHMLAAVDCPLISLFGPTSPAKLAPQVTHGLVLRGQDFGSPHTRAITWEAVIDAVDKLLSIKGSK